MHHEVGTKVKFQLNVRGGLFFGGGGGDGSLGWRRRRQLIPDTIRKWPGWLRTDNTPIQLCKIEKLVGVPRQVQSIRVYGLSA